MTYQRMVEQPVFKDRQNSTYRFGSENGVLAMPKLTKKLPSYRLHKRSGQAIVNLSGKDIYLGPHGTKTSKAEYDRVIGEWLANGRILPESKSSKPTKISDLMFAYWKFAKGFYVKRGKPTGEIPPLKSAIRTFRKVYGKTNVSDFGPLMLIALQGFIYDGPADPFRWRFSGRSGL